MYERANKLIFNNLQEKMDWKITYLKIIKIKNTYFFEYFLQRFKLFFIKF